MWINWSACYYWCRYLGMIMKNYWQLGGRLGLATLGLMLSWCRSYHVLLFEIILLSYWNSAPKVLFLQLHKWGWMHHLARHCVACFLTRGDLVYHIISREPLSFLYLSLDINLFFFNKFVHWEKGRDVFERLLIDSDWAINNGNWLWLSCSSFFYQVWIYLLINYNFSH